MDNTKYQFTYGIDIAKKVMQVYRLDHISGQITNKSVKRDDFLPMFEGIPAGLIGMEACAGSQNLARGLQARGHEVILMHPKAVKAFVRGQKNDRNDAEGIHRAMMNGVRPVAIKDPNSRDLDLLLTMRTKLVKDKTKSVNHVRGILAEYGIVMSRSVPIFMKCVGASINELEKKEDASPLIVTQLRNCVEDIRTIQKRLSEIEKGLEALASQNKDFERFKTAPGVGLITAAMMCVLLSNPALFKNGRQFAAYLGLAPMSFGSGGHNIVCSVPRQRANLEVRALLVQCAHTIRRSKEPSPWVQRICCSKPVKVSVVAIANRLARQLWAMAKKGEDWEDRFCLAAEAK